MTAELISLQYYRLHPHPLSVTSSPKPQKPSTLHYSCFILSFTLHVLFSHTLSQTFPLLAQTALALTPGHPMLSLSNYLTNRSETALISVYCSALLNTASLGGLSGKLWCRDQQARQAEKEQLNFRVRSQEPIHPSLGAFSVSYEAIPHLFQPCPSHGSSSYGLIGSHRLSVLQT